MGCLLECHYWRWDFCIPGLSLCLLLSSHFRPTDEALDRAQCVSEAGGFAGDSGVISRGFGGIRGDSGEVLKHWAVDAQPKARENSRNGPIPMCFPSAAAGGTWPLYNTRKEGEAAWDLEGVLSRAVSRILWTRIEGKAFLVVCW